MLAELEGHVQPGKSGDKSPLRQRWGGIADHCVRRQGIIRNIGKKAHVVHLGVHGSVHGAGAAIGGRATCQPSLLHHSSPRAWGADGFPDASRSPVAPVQGCDFITAYFIKSHLGWDADVGCELS